MKLVIGKGSCGIAAGADKVSDSAEKYIAEKISIFRYLLQAV